ncbi:hypothetical protein WJU16_25145 [Chitinophaga pollutisoli]|uniref:Uncharacterized protein n=1 Tax=Chitinophaga pollutisoli TaxID=3133966 RepID=A0ABZ2YP27_9BACT
MQKPSLIASLVYMKATLYSHTKPLGTIEMKIVDESMGVVGGKLTPSKFYFSLQQIFRRSGGKYNEELQQLNLNLQLENGCYLHPLGGYSIYDIEDFPDEISVDVVGSNYFNIFETLDGDNPISFVKEPWYSIAIETKFALESELSNEISRFRVDKKFSNHYYAEYDFFALASYGPDDDVLFYAVKNNELRYAIIHLTWTGNPEKNPAYPRCTFYNTYEELKTLRMLPDAEEWE